MRRDWPRDWVAFPYMSPESFRWNWRGWARSSEGYSVRLLGRTNLQYRDDLGDLHVSAEAMGGKSRDVVVHTATIPDRPDRPRAQVVDRLRRAFAYQGLTFVEDAQ